MTSGHTRAAMILPSYVTKDREHCIATWHNVVVVDVAGEIDLERMRGLGASYDDLLTRYPDGIVVCLLLRTSASVAAADARSAGTDKLRELKGHIHHVALVVEAKGVVAQMIRSMWRGANVLARGSRLTTTDNIEEAARLLAPHVLTTEPRANSARDLLYAVAQVRKHFSDAFPRPPQF